MDYAARQLNIVELLDVYTHNKALMENVANGCIPSCYWAQQVCNWRGDFKEAKFFIKMREQASDKFQLAEIEMQRARNELIRRHTMWASLAETVTGDYKKYIRPDLYQVYVRYNGPYYG